MSTSKEPTAFLGKAYDTMVLVSTLVRNDKVPVGFSKVVLKCESAEELWHAMHLIHQQGESWLEEVLPREILPADGSHDTTLSHKVLQAYIESWLAKGNKITLVSPGAKDKGKIRTRVDVDELLAGLDEPAAAPTGELELPSEEDITKENGRAA